MRLEEILDPDSVAFNFKAAWEIYESSFPPDERRSLEQQRALFRNPLYKVFAACDGGQVVGLVATWDFGDFVFIEHYAIKDGLRGQGRGTKLLSSFIASANKKIVLETERPETDIARRRIRFYERLGFKLNRHNYTQPAYSPEKKPVPMFIMSHPKEITEQEFSAIREKLHKTVYGLEKPLI